VCHVSILCVICNSVTCFGLLHNAIEHTLSVTVKIHLLLKFIMQVFQDWPVLLAMRFSQSIGFVEIRQWKKNISWHNYMLFNIPMISHIQKLFGKSLIYLTCSKSTCRTDRNMELLQISKWFCALECWKNFSRMLQILDFSKISPYKFFVKVHQWRIFISGMSQPQQKLFRYQKGNSSLSNFKIQW